MQYDSADDGKIYQTKPVYSKPSQHPPKGWTDTTLGYIQEAKQWAMCVIRNRRLMKRPYTCAVHINLNREYPPDQISPMWKKVARKLEDRGIVALWVREPNRLNKLHYHIIVKNEIGKAELKQAIKESMLPRSELQWRKRVEDIKKEWRLCHYVFKAKVKGYNKQGVYKTDLYGAKRLLFKANMPFNTGMEYMTFSEWMARRDEGLLYPDRPPLKGMPRLNTFSGTDGQRKRLHVKPAKKPMPFAPTVRAVKEIVPNKLIPKLKPTPTPPLH